MLNYMQETTDDNVTNQDIEAVHRLVRKVKQNQEVGINYMKSWEREAYLKHVGRDEICQLIRLLTEADRTNDIQKIAADPVYCDKLLVEFNIGQEEY